MTGDAKNDDWKQFEDAWNEGETPDQKLTRLTAELEGLKALVTLLQGAKQEAEHRHNTLLLSLPERYAVVAAAQREADAKGIQRTIYYEELDVLAERPKQEWCVSTVLRTPLVDPDDISFGVLKEKG